MALVQSRDPDGERTILLGPARADATGPTAAVTGSGAVGKSTHAGTSAAAHEAMRSEENDRARGFGLVIALVAGAALALLPMLEGPGWLKALDGTAKASVLLCGLWTHARARRGRYDDRAVKVFGGTCIAGVTVISYYLGVFSPTVLAVTTGIAFFSLGANARLAIILPAAVLSLWIATALLVVAGVVPDVGLVRCAALAPSTRVFFLVMVPLVIAVTAYQARHSRQATLRAIERSNEAIRSMLLREAQLDEVNRELAAVRAAGVGQEGRHTGARTDRWVLGVVVGRGAMGEVYEARDLEGSGRAAIKVLHAGLRDQRDLAVRFQREGAAAARVRSRHVIEVYGSGELEPGVPYLAMEFLTGVDLASLLRAEHVLALRDVVSIVSDLCRGLDAVHAQGIVHRDLKPANLFRVEAPGASPTWKILDFGVAKAAESDSTLTRQGIVGTPDYMSPEQAKGGAVDLRSDVFALGAVVYRALTGAPPFAAPDLPALLYQIVYASPPRPRAAQRDLPADVEHVLALAMAKRPEDRLGSALELSAALAAAAAGTLDPALRARARGLEKAWPWGEVAAGARRSSPPR